MVLTSGKGSERAVLEEYLRGDFTCIFDHGYNKYDLYATIIKPNSHFVTRLLKNAVFEVVEEKPVEPAAVHLGQVSAIEVEAYSLFGLKLITPPPAHK